MRLIKILTILMLINFTIQASSEEEIQCAGAIPQSSIQAQTGGLYKPSSNGANEYMKALIVFVQFDETDVDTNNSIWPKDQMPIWADDLISSSPSSYYPEFTISDYWKDMSMGSFDFIGDVYPNLVIINTEEYYRTNGYHFGECNKDALTHINPYVDFSEYDNWGFNSSTNSFEFVPDGYVDMIIMIYRTPNNDYGWFDAGFTDFNAIALLSDYEFTLNFDGVTIFGDDWISYWGSGLTVKKGIKSLEYTLPIIAHEYGHYLFGAGHGNTGGIMSGSYALSAVERERLGHIAYTNCTQNNFTLTLEDFIMNGDVLRIPIPITNQNSTTFFLVENHQKLSKYDQIIRGGSIGGGYDYTDTGSGIYVWLVQNGDTSIRNVYYEAITADGRWDWTYDGDYYAGSGWYVGETYEGYLPKTKREAVNRHTGITDKKEEHIWWNDHWASKWVDNQPSGSYQLTRDVWGDEFDAFNFDYNELLTPWSNPSTYIDSTTTNISIQLYNQTGNNITVKVFTTEASAVELPPSKPQNLKVGPSANNHPLLTWDSNIEPDTSGYKIYKKVTAEWGWQYLATTTSTSYEDQTEEYLTGGSQANERNIDYRITAVDTQSKESVPSDKVTARVAGPPLDKKGSDDLTKSIPKDYFITQNYPNPFNPTTVIKYQLPEAVNVTIKLYDMLGREVKEFINDTQEAGYYELNFDGSDLSSGTYIYRITAGDFVDSKKLILLK